MKRILFLSLVLFLANVAFAEWQPIVHNYAAHEYSAGTQNWQVLQAPNGWMYVANHEGLLEYDGCTWNLYGMWHSSPLYSIALGENGEVYAGGSNEFGKFIPTSTGHMKYVSLTDSLPTAYRKFGEIWRIFYDDHTVYLQTRHYVFVCHPQENRVDVIDPAATVYAALVQNHTLYVATSNGLSIYSGSRLHPLSGGNTIVGNEVSAMTLYDEHSFLIATDFGGLFMYDGISIKPFKTSVDAFLRRNQLFSVAVSPTHLAFGTVQDGLVLTDRQGGSPYFVSRSKGLQNATALSAYFDDDYNLWTGLDQGISLVLMNAPLRFLRFNDQNIGTGYSFAEYNGYAYYATNQGLYCHRSNDAANPMLIDGSSGQVWRLVIWDNTLFCCHNRGLFKVVGTKLYNLNIPEGVWNVLPYDDSHYIACTYAGFYMFGKANTSPVHLKGYDATALYACMDKWNRLWTISPRGLEVITISDDYTSVKATLVLADESRTRYLLSSLGGEVIVSGENYLAKVAEDGTLVEEDELASILAGKHLYPILQQAPDGSLVYMTNGRLCYRKSNASLPRDLSDISAASQRGLDEMSYKAAVEVLNSPRFFVGGFANLSFNQQGDAIVGGVDGFYSLTVGENDLPSDTSIVYIRSVKNTNLGTIYGERDGNLRTQLLSLPHDDYILHVAFASNHVNRQGMMFQTRLLPEEKEFSDWSSDPFRDLALLTSGRHTLEVRMHITGAPDAETSLIINVAYPWYAQWWAIILFLLLLGGIIYLVAWYAKRRIRRSQQLIAAEKEAEIHKQEVRILQLEQEHAQFDLKSKSRELNSVLLNQVNRNEMVSSLHGDVRRIMDVLSHGEVETARKYLQQLEARLAHGNHEDKDWKRFEENFDFVNDRFISKLSVHYPWMSKQEKKLCVYIYMGLQTKEIAPLLGLSTRGVEMMRYRLRQKMEVEPQLNLKAYFEEMLQQ